MPNITADSSVVLLTPKDVVEILAFSAYFVEGWVMFGGNLLLLLPLLWHQGLRLSKEFNLVAGLALMDCIEGIGYVIAAVHRIPIILAGERDVLTTRLSCLLVPSNVLWYLVELSTGSMLVVLSFDRLLVVLFPLWHMQQGSRYAVTLIAISYGYTLMSGAVGVGLVFASRNDASAYVTKLCYFSRAQTVEYGLYHGQMLGHFALASVVLYLAVIAVYVVRSRKVGATPSDSQAKANAARQRRITTSFGLSALFTFLLFVVPLQLQWWFTSIAENPLLAILCYVTANTNCILNLFIFVIRHYEVRRGLVAVFKCQTLPLDVTKWNTTTKPPVQSNNFAMSIRQRSTHAGKQAEVKDI